MTVVVALLVALLLVAVPVLVVVVAFARLRRGPADPAPAGDGPPVVCLGASTIQGTVSFNVVADLARRLPQFGFVNAGVNGNTSTQVLARLAAVLARTPRFVIVHVGANDVLAIHGGAASDAVAAAKWDGLEANLRAIVRGLSAAGARVGLMSLQPVGEQLGSALNQRVDRANEIIRRTADAEGVGYLPLHERLAEVIATDGTGRAVPDSLAMVARAVVLHLGLGVSLDRIGRRNGFVVHSDGLHLASRGGRIAADLIESFIETEVHSDP